MDHSYELRQSLHSMLTQAEIDFEMWQAMRRARADAKTSAMLNRRYRRFYIAAENALLNSLIIILYKAFETRRDTVNFSQLKKAIPESGSPEVVRRISDLFKNIEKTWRKVCIIRNKVVGHQSMEKSSDEFHEDVDMTISELERMIKDAQDLLSLISENYYETHVIFNLRGTQSFDNLLADLRANNLLVTTRPE